MRKRTILLIAANLLFSVSLVAALYVFSDKINRLKNGFVRFFPPHAVLNMKTLDIKYNSYYVAGLTQGHIYLGNYMQPTWLKIIDYNLTDSQTVFLNPPENEPIAWKILRVAVDSPNVFMMEGLSPKIVQFKLGQLTPVMVPIGKVNFDLALPYSGASLAVRTYDKTSKSNVLGKVSATTGVIDLKKNVLQNQQDGLFSVDGAMSYDNSTGLLTYVYFYRNQFVCMDTNLNVLYRGRTIDTTSYAKIKVGTIQSENSRTFAAPPLTVNRVSCTANGWLFINSQLIANNEDPANFNKNFVIDIYNLQNGQYKYSFYLPGYRNEKLLNFQVRNRKLIAVYEHTLITFDISII